MKTWRIWLVATVALAIILGHAYDIIAMTEHWPFSFYPMYGRLQPIRKLSLLTLRAKMPDGDRFALKSVTEPQYIPQLNETRLRNILMTAWLNPDSTSGTADIIAIMRDFLKLYESRRTHGQLQGPPIRELQFCRMTWKLNDDGHAFAPKVEPLIIVRFDGTVTQSPAEDKSEGDR